MTLINGISWPPMPKWLGPTFDQFAQQDPQLIEAYEWDDYPGEIKGEGNWIDLYLTPGDDYPVGRLWLSPDQEACGLMPLPNCNHDHMTRIILELRELHTNGVDAFAAYAYAKDQYYAGEEQTGELRDARDGAASWP